MRITRLPIAGALVACVAGTFGVTASQQPVFRAGNDAVRVFATVTDRDGRLVTTLGQPDFEVRDDGKPQPLTLFDNTPQPIRLVVMLDVSGSMTGNLSLLRDAASELFVRLRPDDRARVGTFGDDITISSTFTRDANALRAALPRTISPEAPTPLWRAVDEAMDAFEAGEGEQPRPVVLVLSDGKDSGPTGPVSFKRPIASQAEVIDRARRDGVMVYAIGMRSRSGRPSQPGFGPGGLQAAMVADMADPGLARVAEETGGGYLEIRPGQDLGEAFAQVADELHAQYLLGFAPPKKDGKVHDIDVRVVQRGLKARARKTYVAPRER